MGDAVSLRRPILACSGVINIAAAGLKVIVPVHVFICQAPVVLCWEVLLQSEPAHDLYRTLHFWQLALAPSRMLLLYGLCMLARCNEEEVVRWCACHMQNNKKK